jgi:hypothetical protein
MANTAGYSGTPLIKKLGFKPGAKVLLIDAPPNYMELLGPDADQLDFVGSSKAKVDAIHAFVLQQDRLLKFLSTARTSLVPNGMIWISWPKRAAKVETDITEDVIRDIALKNGLVDVKVCAIDATWSGLKLVIRVKDR